MDTKLYRVEAKICLVPVWHLDPPRVRVSLDNHIIFDDFITDKTLVEFDQEFCSGTHTLQIEFTNKTDQDTKPDLGLDKAVVIDHIVFNKIQSPKFVWQGIYRPEYPELWLAQQTTVPSSELKYHTYLGWNGKWTLTFTAPIFTWIHQVENLGWIYG